MTHPRGHSALSRRNILRGGLGAAALGFAQRYGMARGSVAGAGCLPTGALALGRTAPIARVTGGGPTLHFGGLPFAPWFSGDDFRGLDIPFHYGTGDCPGDGLPPEPQERVEVAVVGGGLSGLASAYLLREHGPVLFELHERFGGSAQGEHWRDTSYSLGNAYVITPDRGTFLEEFYVELGLDKVVRVDRQDPDVELGGRILDDFFCAPNQPPDVVLAFDRYRRLVTEMAQNSYPDLPLPQGQDNQWILDLDRLSLRDHIEQSIGLRVPAPLDAAIQAYCYSSFAAGWEEISAASGWNFLAAEEFHRWVFPGGNAYIAQELWRRLKQADEALPAGCAPVQLRAGCTVTDVRLKGNEVQVTYRDTQGVCRSLLAKKVVMACPKHVAKRMIPDLFQLDARKADAMFQLEYRPYLVANVLLDAPIQQDFYDAFLLESGEDFPMNVGEAPEGSRVVDMLNGHYARPVDSKTSVLTLYWPLPWDDARWTLLIENGFQTYARELAPQIRRMLRLLDVPSSAVRQVRMTRWGHALPIARPGLIADGVTEHLRRPIEDKIYFVNQDNWALPAVENSLLDARHYTRQILGGL